MPSITLNSVSGIKDVSAKINYSISYSEYSAAPSGETGWELNKLYLDGNPKITASDGSNLAPTSSSANLAVAANSQISMSLTMVINLIAMTARPSYKASWDATATKTNEDGTTTTIKGKGTGWGSTAAEAEDEADDERDDWRDSYQKDGYSVSSSVDDAVKVSDATYVKSSLTYTSNTITFYTHPGAVAITKVQDGWYTEDESVLVCFSGIEDFDSKAEQWGKWYNQGVTNTLKPMTWSSGPHYLSAEFLNSFYASYGASASYATGNPVSASMFTSINSTFNNMGEGKTVTAS